MDDEVVVKESKHGLEIYDDEGRRFIIEIDNQGRLTINCPFGNIFVQPQYANSIAITSDER